MNHPTNESTQVEVFGSLDRMRALRALFAEPELGFGQRELAGEAGLEGRPTQDSLRYLRAVGKAASARTDTF
jgi:hypothetical protein